MLQLLRSAAWNEDTLNFKLDDTAPMPIYNLIRSEAVANAMNNDNGAIRKV